MSRYTGSRRAIARGDRRVMPVWLVKGYTVARARYGGFGAEVRRECKEVRGSPGTGNNEEESLLHFLGLAFGL